MQRKIALFLIVLPLLFTACGGGSKSMDASGSIAGNWQMSLQPSDTKLSPNTQSGFLVQSGNNVTGSLLFTDSVCTGIGPVSGTISGTNVSIVTSPTGVSVNLTGTVASGQASMSGSYTILSTGCSAKNVSPETGTWTATLVPSLTGNIQATSTLTSVTSVGTIYDISGQLTQGPNTGLSNAPITGIVAITVDANSPTGSTNCLANATNAAGTVSGTSVVLNLTDGSGNQYGEIYGTLDGTSLTGTYEYFPPADAVKPCNKSDHGTAMLSF